MSTKTDTTYNGWTNRSTWLVNLWITNDPGPYEWARELVSEHANDRDAGDAIEEGLPEMMDFPVNGLASDLVTQCMGEVNWIEIAAALRED